MYRTPPNKQAEWGGTTYQPQSPLVSSIGDYPQQTLIGQQGPDGHQASGMNPSSQVPFTASYSDDLFNPTLWAPSVSSVPIFSLPEVHFHAHILSLMILFLVYEPFTQMFHLIFLALLPLPSHHDPLDQRWLPQLLLLHYLFAMLQVPPFWFSTHCRFNCLIFLILCI